MATEVGVGYVSIVPSAKGFGKALGNEIGPDLPKVGREAGESIGKGIKSGVKSSTANLGDALKGVGSNITGLGRSLFSGFASVGKVAMQGVKMGAIGVAAAVGGAAMAAVSFTKAASSQEQALGALQSVFKDQAKAAEAAAREGTKLNMSTTDYAQAATLLGSQLKNLGVKQADLLPQTKDLLGLAADMAAQFGGSTMEAVEALTSAFRGETDPIERYGMSLSQTAIEAEAVSGGFIKAEVNTVKLQAAQARLAQAQANLVEKQKSGTASAEELQTASAAVATAEDAIKTALEGKMPKMDAATKLAATQSLIMKQATDTLGAHNRELNTAASAQEHMRSVWENTKATLGEALLPVASMLYRTIGALLPRLTEALLPAVQYLAQRMIAWGAWVAGNMPQIEAALGRFADMVIEKWPLVVSWFGGMAQVIRDNWPQVWGAVNGFANDVIDKWPQVRYWLKDAATVVKDNWPAIKDTANDITAAVKRVGQWTGTLWGYWQSLPPGVKQTLAMLAIAQKTGVLSVAFKVTDIVGELVKRIGGMQIAATQVTVTGPVTGGGAGAGSRVGAGIAAAGGMTLGGISALIIGLTAMAVAGRAAVDYMYRRIGGADFANIMREASRISSGTGMFAQGGAIYGTGSRDSVPIMAQPGEFMLNRRMVDQFGGIPRLESIRQGAAGGSAGVTVDTLVINNPVAERASESLPRTVRRLAYAGGLA